MPNIAESHLNTGARATGPGRGEAAHGMFGVPTWPDSMEDALKDPVHIRQFLAERPALPWAYQPQAEHDAELARTWGARTTANRRILQGAEDDDGAIMHLLPGLTAWCDDPLAANMGEGGRCTHDCEMLQRHYFPAEESHCFRYDAVMGGWPAALLARKQAWSDSTNTIVVPNDENWIIQGALGPDGVPVKLDARISSGTAVDFSEASIIVRHVRFSGQSAPLDPHAAARDYSQGFMSNPYFSDGETRLGGAFSYEGGGLYPEVHTPKLVFEHVVFDRNQAISGAAVWICGRANTISSLQLVVDECLFFRNTAVYLMGGLYVINTMPGVHLVNNTEFVGASTYGIPAPCGFAAIDTKTGVEGQVNTYTIANSHVDGGGVPWSYNCAGIFVSTNTALATDGTIHEAIFERVTVVDIDSNQLAAPLFCGANGLRELHCVIRECHAARIVGVAGGLLESDWHSITVSMWNPTTVEISRLTIEDSGSFVEGSRGTGTLAFNDDGAMMGYPPKTEWHVVDSMFVRNQASRGGAIGIGCYEVAIIVQRCFFEVRANCVSRLVHVGNADTKSPSPLLITCMHTGQRGDTDRWRHLHPRHDILSRARQCFLRQRHRTRDLGEHRLVCAHYFHRSVGP
jgi:hypothetical protein